MTIFSASELLMIALVLDEEKEKVVKNYGPSGIEVGTYKRENFHTV